MKNKCSIEENLKNYLIKSADMLYNIAKDNCKNGIVDENCFWYHSIWQYLRIMDVVSSPTWHNNFYIEQLSNALKNEGSNNILISGTADYSMLAYVISCVKERKVKANIYVLDTCKTPLIACEWYGKEENIEITCINKNILDYCNNNFFDIICTDAFLTRFSNENAQLVINKWYNLLKINGKIITTVRIHKINETNNYSNMENFINRIRNNYEYYKNDIKISLDELLVKAELYANNMKSNNLGDKNCILSKFEKFVIDYNVRKVTGELMETKYVELVAQKKEIL